MEFGRTLLKYEVFKSKREREGSVTHLPFTCVCAVLFLSEPAEWGPEGIHYQPLTQHKSFIPLSVTNRLCNKTSVFHRNTSSPSLSLIHPPFPPHPLNPHPESRSRSNYQTQTESDCTG